VDAGAHGFDDFAGEAVVICFFGGVGEDDVFEEDGDALDGLGAAGALGGGELECVDDCRGKGARRVRGGVGGGGRVLESVCVRLDK
jgi:hypothetical protein